MRSAAQLHVAARMQRRLHAAAQPPARRQRPAVPASCGRPAPRGAGPSNKSPMPRRRPRAGPAGVPVHHRGRRAADELPARAAQHVPGGVRGRQGAARGAAPGAPAAARGDAAAPVAPAAACAAPPRAPAPAVSVAPAPRARVRCARLPPACGAGAAEARAMQAPLLGPAGPARAARAAAPGGPRPRRAARWGADAGARRAGAGAQGLARGGAGGPGARGQDAHDGQHPADCGAVQAGRGQREDPGRVHPGDAGRRQGRAARGRRGGAPPPAPKHTPPPPPPPPPRPGSQTGMASVAGGVLPTRVQGAAQTGAQRALQRPGCASPCPTLPCAGR